MGITVDVVFSAFSSPTVGEASICGLCSWEDISCNGDDLLGAVAGLEVGMERNGAGTTWGQLYLALSHCSRNDDSCFSSSRACEANHVGIVVFEM